MWQLSSGYGSTMCVSLRSVCSYVTHCPNRHQVFLFLFFLSLPPSPSPSPSTSLPLPLPSLSLSLSLSLPPPLPLPLPLSSPPLPLSPLPLSPSLPLLPSSSSPPPLLTHSPTHSPTHSLTHSCIDDSEMDPCHTESQGELSASDRVPGIRHREGGRSEARQGAGNKTAEGNKHAEGQATGPVEPRRDPEGDGNQEQTAREQDGQAGRHATDLKTGTYPLSPCQDQAHLRKGTISRRASRTSARGASRSPAGPGCRRPPVLTPMPYEGEHPGEAMQAAACCCR